MSWIGEGGWGCGEGGGGIGRSSREWVGRTEEKIVEKKWQGMCCARHGEQSSQEDWLQGTS
jgi:hypothetical protein